MKIAVVGKGRVGGGLANLWEKAGHDIVARIGHDGGEVSDADVVLVAVPGGAIADALDKLQGMSGKTVIDATNLVGANPPSGFDSNAEFVKSKTNGPTAKSFNLNFANQYGKLAEAKSRPSNLWSGDDEARPVVERLNRDAGYEPVRLGGLDKAATQEHGIDILFAISKEMGPFVYRSHRPNSSDAHSMPESRKRCRNSGRGLRIRRHMRRSRAGGKAAEIARSQLVFCEADVVGR